MQHSPARYRLSVLVIALLAVGFGLYLLKHDRAKIEITSNSITRSISEDATPDGKIAQAIIVRSEPDDIPTTGNSNAPLAAIDKSQAFVNESGDYQYLNDEEFFALQSSIIDKVISLPAVNKNKPGSLPTVEEIGLPENELSYYSLISDDRVIAINQIPIEALLGDGMSGSLLAGGSIELQIKRGDTVFTVIFGQY